MKTHGMRNSPEYRVWANMKQRCLNSSHYQWKDYGGRGISVCDEWMNSFPAFLRDMGEKPHPKFQLDRINNERGYSPDNCRWIPAKVNMMNRTTTKRVSINGEEKTLMEWSEETGINYHTINSRMRRGIEGEELLKPIKKR